MVDNKMSGDLGEAGAEQVLDLWFGELNAQGRASQEKRAGWWKKDPAFDAMLREQFLADHQAIVAGERDDWLKTARGRLAYVIVLDQFSRNMYRGSAEMYAADDLAVKAALAAIENGDDKTLPADMRNFLYMPLMHSEELAMQERCVELFQSAHASADEALKEGAANQVGYAILHRDIVRDWGRFPHRNEILGRLSTPEEIEFLKQPNSSF
jgi:uncharacterized protein (DUF924 family)